MTRNTLVAACIAAVSLLPASAVAQTDAPAPSIERARELFAEKRPTEALAVLRRLPPGAEVARLRVEIALSIDDFPQAVDAYDELAGPLKSPSNDVLRSIARRRAVTLRPHTDPQVRVEACETLMLAAAAPDCAEELQAAANDASSGIDIRLTAARALFEHNVRGAAALLDAVIRQGMQNSPATTATALEQLPASVSNEPLKQLLTSSNADAQYLATLALTRRRLPDAIPLLRTVATDPEAGAARLMAYIGLAALNQPDGIRILRETLPLTKGRDRLEAARALVVLKDPEGPKILESLLTSEHEMLRVETAELLYSTRSPRAAAALTAATESSNQWIRTAAIAAAARVGMPLTRSVRNAVANSSPRVALAASRAILLDLRARR